MAISVEFSTKASVGAVKRLPSGYLDMGSRFHPREQPRRTVYVGEIEIAYTPVTVHQYAAFLNSGSNKQERWWSKAGWEWLLGKSEGWGRENRNQPEAWEIQRQRPYHPVVGITLHEAQAYCAWVAAEKKRNVRLPTEEEWEYAARGEDGRPYPWGDEFVASWTNTVESERLDTVEVGSIQEDLSPFGVAEMAGNVQEWTSTQYFQIADEIFLQSELYVARGGSFNDTSFGSRTTYRRGYPPGYYYPYLGMRVVVESR